MNEKNFKKKVKNLLKKKIEEGSFRTDFNLEDNNLIKDINLFLIDFVENDVKMAYLEKYFVQNREYYCLVLKDENKRFIDLTRTEFIELI